MTLFIYVFIILAIYTIYLISKQRNNDYQRGYVKFCTNSDNEFLIRYIMQAQKCASIPKKYFIDSCDDKNVDIILSKFKDDLKNRYFNGATIDPKKNRREFIREEDFFMYSLFRFLVHNSAKSEFYGNKMQEKRISYTEYGSWGAKHFDATYTITNFAVSLLKLELITCEYCKSKESLAGNEEIFDINTDVIKKDIETKTISTYRM